MSFHRNDEIRKVEEVVVGGDEDNENMELAEEAGPSMSEDGISLLLKEAEELCVKVLKASSTSEGNQRIVMNLKRAMEKVGGGGCPKYLQAGVARGLMVWKKFFEDNGHLNGYQYLRDAWSREDEEEGNRREEQRVRREEQRVMEMSSLGRGSEGPGHWFKAMKGCQQRAKRAAKSEKKRLQKKRKRERAKVRREKKRANEANEEGGASKRRKVSRGAGEEVKREMELKDRLEVLLKHRRYHPIMQQGDVKNLREQFSKNSDFDLFVYAWCIREGPWLDLFYEDESDDVGARPLH